MRRFITTCVLAASAAVVALANHPATFVLRNGDKVSGELSYKGGSAYTLNGRDYEAQDVAVVAFVNDDPSADELGKISTQDNNPNELDRHAFVTRNGQVMLGKLYKFSPDGETVTFDAREGGRRDISANDLARIYINPGAARSVYNNILRAGTQAGRDDRRRQRARGHHRRERQSAVDRHADHRQEGRHDRVLGDRAGPRRRRRLA